MTSRTVRDLQLSLLLLACFGAALVGFSTWQRPAKPPRAELPLPRKPTIVVTRCEPEWEGCAK